MLSFLLLASLDALQSSLLVGELFHHELKLLEFGVFGSVSVDPGNNLLRINKKKQRGR